MFCDLNRVLEYKNPAVLKLYNQKYPNHKLSAEIAFREMLKYLWLSKKHADDLPTNKDNEHFPSEFFMARSMQEIDDMWHEFILFTQDYTNFCKHYFGEYLHHLPNLFDNRIRPREEVNNEIARLLPYIYDHLGDSTLRLWFADFLDENTEANLR